MAKTFDGNMHKQNFRPSADDWTLLKKLEAKLGVRFANIVRLAIRTLAQKEGCLEVVPNGGKK
jgi:hypothetical protein